MHLGEGKYSNPFAKQFYDMCDIPYPHCVRLGTTLQIRSLGEDVWPSSGTCNDERRCERSCGTL